MATIVVEPFTGLLLFKGQVPTIRDIAFTVPTPGLIQFKGYVPTTAKVKQPSPGKWLYVGQTPTITLFYWNCQDAGSTTTWSPI